MSIAAQPPTEPRVYRVDPRGLHRVAASLARPVALGLLPLSRARAALAVAAIAAERRGELLSPQHVDGLRIRLTWTLLDRARALVRTRRRLLDRDIPRAIAVALEAHAPYAAIVAAAERVNADAGNLLLRAAPPSAEIPWPGGELRAVCDAEMLQQSRRDAARRKRRAP